MADDTETEAETSTTTTTSRRRDHGAGAIDLSALIAERDKYRDELASARSRIRELNNESATHRINAERLGKLADERAAALEAARAEAQVAAEKARNEAKEAIEAAKRDSEARIEKQREEIAHKLSEAQNAAAERERVLAEREQAARGRVTQSDLRLAAKDAGMVDLDALKLLDAAALKIGEDGGVTNAAEAMAALKAAKPWAFGQVSTSTNASPPATNAGAPKNYNDMTDAEKADWKRANGLR